MRVYESMLTKKSQTGEDVSIDKVGNLSGLTRSVGSREVSRACSLVEVVSSRSKHTQTSVMKNLLEVWQVRFPGHFLVVWEAGTCSSRLFGVRVTRDRDVLSSSSLQTHLAAEL